MVTFQAALTENLDAFLFFLDIQPGFDYTKLYHNLLNLFESSEKMRCQIGELQQHKFLNTSSIKEKKVKT